MFLLDLSWGPHILNPVPLSVILLLFCFTLGTPFPREPKNWTSNTKSVIIILIIWAVFFGDCCVSLLRASRPGLLLIQTVKMHISQTAAGAESAKAVDIRRRGRVCRPTVHSRHRGTRRSAGHGTHIRRRPRPLSNFTRSVSVSRLSTANALGVTSLGHWTRSSG